MVHSKGWSFVVAALALVACGASAQKIVPSPLLAIDQNRSTVVERIVGEWGDRLAASNAGITSAQLREILTGLRSDHLLAASLAGSVEGLRDVVSGALVHGDSVVSPGLIHTKSLGDTNDDLVYTPVTPCRILDTRNGTVPPYNSVMVGGAAFPVAANLGSFTTQGGSATSCNLPSSFQAIAVTFTVLNPNYDAFLAAGNSSDFATLTQSVVMDFSANKGLANTAIVPVDATVKFYLGLPALVTTNVIADIAGYFQRPTNYGGTHTITGLYATDSGGFGNTATGDYSTVAGGNLNQAGGGGSTVGGGGFNVANGFDSTIAGGTNNTANGSYSTVGGGISNTASGQDSTVVGGYLNVASGDNSLAAGQRAKTQTAGGTPTVHYGAFVWADQSNFDFNSTANNEFSARATGGVRFVLGINGTTGTPTWTCAASNGNSWACSSDRNLKENLDPVNGVSVLERLSKLPLYFWNAKGTDPNIRHMGPTAQDFMSAFALGNNDKLIGMQDAEGVALAAIQGLHQMMQQKDAKLSEQAREISMLKRKLEVIEAKLGLN